MRQVRPRNLFFFIVESCLLVLGAWLVIAVFNYWHPAINYDLELFIPNLISLVLFYHFSLFYFDLYDFRTRATLFEYGLRLIQSLGLLCLILAFFSYFFPAIVFPSPLIFFVLAVDFFLIICWRLFFDWFSRQEKLTEPIMIVGGSLISHQIHESIVSGNTGYRIVAVVGDSKLPVAEGMHVDDYQQIYQEAVARKVNLIVVSMSERRGVFPAAELLRCKMSGITVVEDIDFYERLEKKILVDNLRPSWLIFTEGFKKPHKTKVIKRVIGMSLAAIGIIITLPLMVLVALAVKLDSNGPVFFVQERLGEDEIPFRLIKFRSMRTDAEKNGPVWAREEDDRVTRIGKFIRKSRIDELPQLFNIFMGDMSFVGPRPERKYFVDQLKKEIPYYNQRFTVKPGVTGWAQVRFPYGASVEDAKEKLQYELYYIKYLSPLLDFFIVLETIKVILFGRGGR